MPIEGESISIEYVRAMLEAFAQGSAEVIGNHSEGKYRWQKVTDLRQLLRLMERGYKLRDRRDIGMTEEQWKRRLLSEKLRTERARFRRLYWGLPAGMSPVKIPCSFCKGSGKDKFKYDIDGYIIFEYPELQPCSHCGGTGTQPIWPERV